MKVSEDRQKKIDHLLSRNVEEVIDKSHLRNALLSGKKLRVKLGIDPTSPDLHLGHAVVLRKLREFQELGCVVVLIIGDFTARIGDPSGRDKTRPPLTEEQIKENLQNYFDQAGKIIDIRKAEVVHNSSWFEKEGVDQLLRLTSAGTFQQVMRRADFKKRIDADQDITLTELLYPLFQGYDSVKVSADVEIGGTDQTFNLLAGRRVQRHFGMPEQDVLTLQLLEGLDGVKKMSKSLGNYIGLTDEPNDMFGKVMSLPDSLMNKYFELCTELSAGEIKKLGKELKPKNLKERLGIEIVTLYHGEKAAKNARENFEKLFSKKEIPQELPELKVKGTKTALLIVVASKVFESRSEARRLIEQGGFGINGETERNPSQLITLDGGEVIRIGKRHFFRVK
jgi:tyrosyl-tRNA synthetase